MTRRKTKRESMIARQKLTKIMKRNHVDRKLIVKIMQIVEGVIMAIINACKDIVDARSSVSDIKSKN